MPILQGGGNGWASALAGLIGVGGSFLQGQQQARQAKAAQDAADADRAQRQALIQAQIGNLNSERLGRENTLYSSGFDPHTGARLAPPVAALAETPADQAPPGTTVGPTTAVAAPSAAALGAGAGAVAGGAASTASAPIPTQTSSPVVVPHPSGPVVVHTTTLKQLAAKPNVAKPPATAWQSPGAPSPGQPYQGSVPPSIMSQLGPLDPSSFAPAPGFYGKPYRQQATDLLAKADTLEKGAQPYLDRGTANDPVAVRALAAAADARKQAAAAIAQADKADTTGMEWERNLWTRYSGMAGIISMSQRDQDTVRYHIAQIGVDLARNNISIFDANKRFEGVLASVGASDRRTGAMVNIANQSSSDRAKERDVQVRGQNLNHADRAASLAAIHGENTPGIQQEYKLANQQFMTDYRTYERQRAKVGTNPDALRNFDQQTPRPEAPKTEAQFRQDLNDTINDMKSGRLDRATIEAHLARPGVYTPTMQAQFRAAMDQYGPSVPAAAKFQGLLGTPSPVPTLPGTR